MAPEVVASTDEKLVAEDVEEDIEDARVVTFAGGVAFVLFGLKQGNQIDLERSRVVRLQNSS